LTFEIPGTGVPLAVKTMLDPSFRVSAWVEEMKKPSPSEFDSRHPTAMRAPDGSEGDGHSLKEPSDDRPDSEDIRDLNMESEGDSDSEDELQGDESLLEIGSEWSESEIVEGPPPGSGKRCGSYDPDIDQV
jgi:hypothetical protein